VQAAPSSHPLELLSLLQVLSPLQESSVQTLLSSHEYAVPAHAPAAQVSVCVQAAPSSQLAVLLVCVQVLSPLQESSVQTSLSSHV